MSANGAQCDLLWRAVELSNKFYKYEKRLVAFLNKCPKPLKVYIFRKIEIEKLGPIIIDKPEFLVLETGIALAIRKAFFFLFSFALLIASVSR